MRQDRFSASFRGALAIAATAVGLVAVTTLPAAAHMRVAVQHSRAGREPAQVYRAFNYAPLPPATTYPPPDYCDLPSAGCESYLAN
jgi:hypothetical protein